MEFTIATILAQFIDDKLLPGKVLEKKLGCDDDDESIEKLQIILDILENIGILTKEFGKYKRVYEENVVEAKLRCSSKGFCFAIQDDEESEDIYVRESHLSNAWNGDRVLVKIIKEGSRRRSPEGEVKLILERANPSLLARVVAENGNFKGIPLDDRLLFELELRQNGESLEDAVDHLVHVNIVRYQIAQNPPLGKVTRILGSDAEAAADTDIVSCKHDLPQSFNNKVLKALESLKINIDYREIAKRRDLRTLTTFTIEKTQDVQTLPLIENAFTLEKTQMGEWQVGIHITDIAQFIEADSYIDKEARKRGTSINLNDKVISLFPVEVNRGCSLVPGEDRYCVSVLLTLDSLGKVVEFNIEPTVIRVDHHFSYQQVQTLLVNQQEVKPDMRQVVEKLHQLFFELTPKIKGQRLTRGGFEISLTETKSLYKDEGRLGAIIYISSLPVVTMLTELAVLAGKAVAEHLTALDVPGIYCTQLEPDWDDLEDLLKLCNNLGLAVNLESEENIVSGDYQSLTQEFAKSPANKVLNYLLYGSLKPVKYASNSGAHFGLAYLDSYTHCVSPGQRYADLLIQRVLKAIFAHGRDRRHSRAKNNVNICSSTCHGKINWNVLPTEIQDDLELHLASAITHLNERQKVAIDAEKDLEGLKKAEKMKERTGLIFQGLITGVQSYGFFVQIEDLLVEGLVHVSSLKDDWYEYRARHSCLIGRKNRIAYRLGDTVEVEVKSVDYYRQQIDLVTVSGGTTMYNSDELEDE